MNFSKMLIIFYLIIFFHYVQLSPLNMTSDSVEYSHELVFPIKQPLIVDTVSVYERIKPVFASLLRNVKWFFTSLPGKTAPRQYTHLYITSRRFVTRNWRKRIDPNQMKSIKEDELKKNYLNWKETFIVLYFKSILLFQCKLMVNLIKSLRLILLVKLILC